MTEASVIAQASGLTKSFGRKQVLRGIDFTIPSGRVYGLVGENGAGKTTTLNALLGLTGCGGRIEVLGLDPFRHRARLMREVAFISDVASLPRFLRVGQLLDLVNSIHPAFDRKKAETFLKDTKLKRNQRIKTLSKGMLAQLHLSVVMAIDARLLVLDEPTLGLDIPFRKMFYRRLIDDYMSAERTIIITTHQVDEIEFMLTDILFIRDGEILLDQSMEEIAEQYAQVLVSGESVEDALAMKPLYSEKRFDLTAMVFKGIPRQTLEAYGPVTTPTLSDLFVTLAQHEPEGEG